jgi:hypothetical protein
MTNFQGPIEVVLVPVGRNTDGKPTGSELAFFAKRTPDGARVRVDLSAGRNGVVFIAERNVIDMSLLTERDYLPTQAALHPVHPASQTTPFNVDDFGPGISQEELLNSAVEEEPDLNPEDEAELEAIIDADKLAAAEAVILVPAGQEPPEGASS